MKGTQLNDDSLDSLIHLTEFTVLGLDDAAISDRRVERIRSSFRKVVAGLARGGQWMMGSGTLGAATNQGNTLSNGSLRPP
ncbi:MAG: hypothetical protein ABGZ35_15140 [Planctomycetaceae bacterium]